MQNAVQNGDSINYTPTADVTGGDLVVFNGCVGVAYTDIAAGETGALAMVGVFTLEKTTAVFTQGDVVYADADDVLTPIGTGEGTVRVGIAWQTVAANDGTVDVKINV